MVLSPVIWSSVWVDNTISLFVPGVSSIPAENLSPSEYKVIGVSVSTRL